MSYGVFRPDPRLWRLFTRRRGAPATESPLREQSGATGGVAVGRATPVKVAIQGGSCSAAAAPAGQSAKRAPSQGPAVAAAGPSVTARKVAVPAPTAAAAAAGTAQPVKSVSGSGHAVAAATSTGRVVSGQRVFTAAVGLNTGLTKRARATARTSGVATTHGAGGRVAEVAGTTAGIATGQGAAAKVAPAAGHAIATITATVRFAAPTAASADGVALTQALSKKVAVTGGVCCARPALTGGAAKKTAQAGRAIGASVGRGRAAKKMAQAGRCTGAAWTRSFPNVVGPTSGTRVSVPIALPDFPIAGSRIMWEATVPTGATVTVETSVDNGATWQLAVNGDPIERLVPGTQTYTTVLTRVTLTRPTPDSPTPRMHRMEVEIAVDTSVDELVPCGVFTLNDIVVNDSVRGLSIELSGADLSRRVARNRWDDTFVVAEGTNYADAIKMVIEDRLPSTVFNFSSTDRATPRLFFGEQASNDPWQDCLDMATAIGYELFFDARGICVLRPEPNPDVDDSVWTFEDVSNPTITELARRVTDENTYNKVIAMGEGTGNVAPVRATAIDDDPSSPTYYLGPYGTVTLIVRSPMIATEQQAQEAADALMRRVKGATEAIEMTAVPMPALEPGDVVTIQRGRAKVEGRFLLDQIRLPLGASDAMRAVGRRQRL